MKKTLLFKLLAFSLFALLSVGVVNAQVMLEENFNYSAGSILTDDGWTITGTSVTNPITVTASTISYSGYASSGIGNEVSMLNTGQDVNKTFAAQTSGNVYACFMVNISAANTAGDYFLHFGENPFNSSNLRGRVFVKKDASDKLAFGIMQSSAATASYSGFDYALNTTYLIVLKSTIVAGTANDISAICINPALTGTEPTTGWLTSTEASTSSDIINYGAICLRQGSATNAPTLKIDGIRVATTWNDAIGVSASINAADLFFSEYDEGSGGNDRALEIFNGTGAPIDLSAYTVRQSHDGAGFGTTTEYITPLSGTLADGDVYVIYNSATTNTAISSVGDLALTYLTGCTNGCKNASFTGNDAMGLYKNGVLIDVIGIELVANGAGPWAVAGIPGATMDHTLVRKNTVTEGTTNWAASAGTDAANSEWKVYPVNSFEYLGTHTFGEIVDVTPPNFTGNIDDGATEVAVDTKIIVTFDEPIRNIDNSEITNANVAALLTLKETNASGADVPFTATIDATKKIITATPSASLKIAQLYYAAIVPVEDTSNNATTGGSITFTTITKYNVTFNVDMSLVKGFDPLTDTVYIAGNLAGWAEPGKNLDLQMKDPDGNMIYTIVLGVDLTAVPVVSNIAYKFFINAGWNTWGEWVGDPNRLATITGNTTLNAIFGNKGEPVFVNPPYVQNFEYSTANVDMSLAGWTNANVVAGGTALWLSKLYTANKYGQVTSYGATSTGADQIWLITPGILMADTLITDLTFDVNVGYWTHDGLTVMISTNYDQTVGGITTATWTDVTREFVIPSTPTNAYGTFTNAGHLDVSAYTGTMYVAFVYNGNKTASHTTTYQLDNVAVNVIGYVGLAKLPSSEINIYPNPSNGRLLISNPSNKAQEIAVYNAVGKQVTSAVSAKGVISLDITTQPKGFYLVKITNKANKTVQFKKIILN